MEGCYTVYLGTEPVGEVAVAREGLYYHFCCSCRLSSDVCKLYVNFGERQECLGTLIPEGDRFCLDTRLSVKRFGAGAPEFSVMPNRAVLTGKFIPLCPEEPFSYLERLKDAYLTRRNGQLGVVIREKAGT